MARKSKIPGRKENNIVKKIKKIQKYKGKGEDI
jgi:hypothetical protein